MISQPTKRVSKLSETTSVYIPKANRLINAKKREYIGSTDGTWWVSPCSVTVAPCGGKPFTSALPTGWLKL